MSATAVAAPPALRVTGLHVRYGQLTAVHDLSIDVPAGELVVLLGANGAGKSSLLKTVMGLERAAEGTIELHGEPLGRTPSHARVGRGLGYLPEGRGVFPTMTVEENILAGLQSMSRKAHALETAYTLFPRMGERRRQMAGSLSGGEQQMLSLSRALAGDPKLLLLDELSLGLAPAIVVQLFEKIKELRDGGMTILLVEQFAHAALRIADRAGVMVRGRLTRFGAAEEFARMSPDELASHYFGSGEE
ncbi:MAG: ABC transporter ATP-binding protein [Actinobacteria bacterium]|nr:ABC transporter ATP-binding protein [Actinomycetota bacterium]